MKEWWQSLEQRERMFVGGLAVFLVVFLFYMLLIDPLFSGASEYREKVAEAESDLTYMRGTAAQLKLEGPGSRDVTPNGPITVIVDRTRRNYNITTENMQTVGDDGLRVRLDDTSFDAIVSWLGDLRAQHGIAIEAANLRQGDVVGTTNATLTLRRQ